MTTLDGFATALIAKSGTETPILCLALAGEWDRAAEHVERSTREVTCETEIAEIKELWERLTTDIDAVCAHLHKREAATVKALKLERIWEPSPFPVELPASERSKSAEPLFLPTPWIPSSPGLWQELPAQPGEVRFSKQYLYGEDGLILPTALSAEEAKERHEALEDYVMVARLADRLLLKIVFSGWDRNNPEVSTYDSTWTPSLSLDIELLGASHVARARTSRDWDRTGVIELWCMEVYKRYPRRRVWLCYIKLEENENAIHDWRSGETTYAKSLPTPEERELATLPIPAFGEYAAVAERLRGLLHVAGYGELK